MKNTKCLPKFSDVARAARRIQPYIVRTPLLCSPELDDKTQAKVFVKAECLQLTGSFKVRGAFNRLLSLSNQEKKRGVVAYSSGNHGQAVAFAARTLGVSAVIVMPKTAPRIKITKTRSHGAQVLLYNPQTQSREAIADSISKKSGRVLIPSFDDPYIVAGQGTSAMEVIEESRDLKIDFDAYFICTGGAGLLSGSALVLNKMSPMTKLYSVEPKDYDDFAQSLKVGKRSHIKKNPSPSICDAIVTPSTSDLTFAIASRHVTRGLTVSDEEVKCAMRFAFRNLKIVVEPGGAVALAAVLAQKIPTKGRSIGLVISGGNVDPTLFGQILNE